MKLIRAKDRLNSTLYFVKSELKMTEELSKHVFQKCRYFLKFVTYLLLSKSFNNVNKLLLTLKRKATSKGVSSERNCEAVFVVILQDNLALSAEWVM